VAVQLGSFKSTTVACIDPFDTFTTSSSSLTFNVSKTQFEKNNALFPQFCTLSRCQMISGYMAVLFTSIARKPFLAPTLDNADPLFALVIHQVSICTILRWRIKTQLVAVYNQATCCVLLIIVHRVEYARLKSSTILLCFLQVKS